MSDPPAVSELRKAAHKNYGISHLATTDPNCLICVLADRLEEAEHKVNVGKDA